MTIEPEFNRRIQEIDAFFELLQHVEYDFPKISGITTTVDATTNSNSTSTVTYAIGSTHIDTLRATAFLLLYNLVESTIFNCIRSIFDEIKDLSLTYDDLIQRVKIYWLKNNYKHDENIKKETIVNKISLLIERAGNDPISIITNELDFGGSLDAQKIFETAKSLQIDCRNVVTIYRESEHGEALIQTKKKRNHLAHGEHSFTDIGRLHTVSDLIQKKDYIEVFLKEFILATQQYITAKNFKQ